VGGVESRTAAVEALVLGVRRRCGFAEPDLMEVLSERIVKAIERLGARRSRVEGWYARGVPLFFVASRRDVKGADYIRVWVAAGADRFRLTIGAGHARMRQLDGPSKPLTIELERAISDEFAQFETTFPAAIEELESDIVRSIAEPEDTDLQSLLPRWRGLHEQVLDFENARRKTASAIQRLFGNEARAAVVDHEDIAAGRERLNAYGEAIAAARRHLIEVQQTLMAAAAVEQAQYLRQQAIEQSALTHQAGQLTVLAAFVVVPSLFVGLLGANVLPWDTVEFPALVGCLVGMVAVGFLAASLLPPNTLQDWLAQSRSALEHRTNQESFGIGSLLLLVAVALLYLGVT
jgi:hypothetical protein